MKFILFSQSFDGFFSFFSGILEVMRLRVLNREASFALISFWVEASTTLSSVIIFLAVRKSATSTTATLSGSPIRKSRVLYTPSPSFATFLSMLLSRYAIIVACFTACFCSLQKVKVCNHIIALKYLSDCRLRV